MFCIYIYKNYIFLMNCNLLICCDLIFLLANFFEVCFARYKHSYSWLILVSVGFKYCFPSFHFQFVYILANEVSFLQKENI
jgi:hypothetical protein